MFSEHLNFFVQLSTTIQRENLIVQCDISQLCAVGMFASLFWILYSIALFAEPPASFQGQCRALWTRNLCREAGLLKHSLFSPFPRESYQWAQETMIKTGASSSESQLTFLTAVKKDLDHIAKSEIIPEDHRGALYALEIQPSSRRHWVNQLATYLSERQTRLRILGNQPLHEFDGCVTTSPRWQDDLKMYLKPSSVLAYLPDGVVEHELYHLDQHGKRRDGSTETFVWPNHVVYLPNGHWFALEEIGANLHTAEWYHDRASRLHLTSWSREAVGIMTHRAQYYLSHARRAYREALTTKTFTEPPRFIGYGRTRTLILNLNSETLIMINSSHFDHFPTDPEIRGELQSVQQILHN